MRSLACQCTNKRVFLTKTEAYDQFPEGRPNLKGCNSPAIQHLQASGSFGKGLYFVWPTRVTFAARACAAARNPCTTFEASRSSRISSRGAECEGSLSIRLLSAPAESPLTAACFCSTQFIIVGSQAGDWNAYAIQKSKPSQLRDRTFQGSCGRSGFKSQLLFQCSALESPWTE